MGSLEDAINRLASAAERNYSGSAVAEIIRQRDEAIAQRDKWKRDAEYYMQDRNAASDRRRKAERKLAALRGVITRMKKQRLP